MVVSESRANLVAAFLALADQAGAELLLLDEGFVTREYAELGVRFEEEPPHPERDYAERRKHPPL